MKILAYFCLGFAWAFLLLETNQIFAQNGVPNSDRVEKRVAIHRVSGNRISITESSGMAGRGRGRRGRGQGMAQQQDQTEQQQSSRRGRRGRGRFSGSSQAGSGSQRLNGERTMIVPDSTRLTFAMTERRTNEFKIGTSINGRLRNSIFQEIPTGGLPARIVMEGNKLVEVNIIQTNDTSLEDIAVKPKRPPRRK